VADSKSPDGIVRRRVLVSGRVQGVFFRDSCRSEAEARGVRGWISNRDDGAVEAVFEGQRPAVEAVIDWCRSGPARASVIGVEVAEEEPRGERGFRIT
jgi:acylphosphatase